MTARVGAKLQDGWWDRYDRKIRYWFIVLYDIHTDSHFARIVEGQPPVGSWAWPILLGEGESLENWWAAACVGLTPAYSNDEPVAYLTPDYVARQQAEKAPK